MWWWGLGLLTLAPPIFTGEYEYDFFYKKLYDCIVFGLLTARMGDFIVEKFRDMRYV